MGPKTRGQMGFGWKSMGLLVMGGRAERWDRTPGASVRYQEDGRVHYSCFSLESEEQGRLLRKARGRQQNPGDEGKAGGMKQPLGFSLLGERRREGMGSMSLQFDW